MTPIMIYIYSAIAIVSFFTRLELEDDFRVVVAKSIFWPVFLFKFILVGLVRAIKE